jgi:hypothetical protein
MSGVTSLLSAVASCFFGMAAVLLTVFLLRSLRRFDRIIALAEMGAASQLPQVLRKLTGR